MKTHNIVLLLTLLWIAYMAFSLTEVYAMDLNPQLELGIGYPVHSNERWTDGNVMGYISATVRACKWKWVECRVGGYHNSDPTTKDAGTSWVGGTLRIGGD